jgi:hypothetical protein
VLKVQALNPHRWHQEWPATLVFAGFHTVFNFLVACGQPESLAFHPLQNCI